MVGADESTCPFQLRLQYVKRKHDLVTPLRYQLWMSKQAFVTSMASDGTFPFEQSVIKILHMSMQHGMWLRDAMDAIPKPSLPDSMFHIAGWNTDLPLFPHQRESLTWMLRMEKLVATKTGCVEVDLTSLPITGTPYVYNQTFGKFTCARVPKKSKIPFRGGVLADNTGSGKTAVVLALTAATRVFPLVPDDVPAIERDSFFLTSATLIVTPVNLPHQWCGEVKKFLARAKLCVITLLNMQDFRKTTIEDLKGADIVITTFNYLTHQQYLRTGAQQVHSWLTPQPEACIRFPSLPQVRAGTRAAVARGQFFMEGHVPLQSFWWKRIVVDESQDMFLRDRGGVAKILYGIEGCMVWGLSGTPDVSHGGSLQDYCEMLYCRPPCSTPAFCKQVVRTCFHRYDRSFLGPMQHNTMMLDMTPSEKERYVQLGVFCEARTTVTTLAAPAHLMEEAEPLPLVDADTLLALLRAEDTVVGRDTPNFAISTLEAHRAGGHMLADCPICMEPRASVITACGHMFCAPCLERSLATKTLCPVCKSSHTTPHHEIQTPTSSPNYHRNLVAMYGTKLAACVEYILKIQAVGECAVLYAQWSHIIKVYARVLRREGLRVGVLGGNTASRATMLRCVVDGDFDVVLMCLDSSISGMNLVRANHVMFIHPLFGSDSYVRQKEEQAIARVYRHTQQRSVHVLRLAFKGTTEEAALRIHENDDDTPPLSSSPTKK